MLHFDRIVLNLRSRGFRNEDIGRLVGVSRSAVCQWARGEKRPSEFRTVLRLLDVHFDRCPDRHTPEVIGTP